MSSRRTLVWVAASFLLLGCPSPTGMDGGANPTGGGAATAGGEGGGAAGGTSGGLAGGTGGGAGGQADGGVDAGVPMVRVNDQLADFGTVDCGGAAVERTVLVENVGSAPLAWRAALEGAQPGEFGLVGTTSGTLAPGASAMVRVRFLDRPGSIGLRTALLRLDNSDPTRTPTVALRAVKRGPVLNQLGDVDFGTWPLGTAVTTTLSLFNTGDVAATVSVPGLQGEFLLPDGGATSSVLVPAGTSTMPVPLPLGFRAQGPGPIELTTRPTSSTASCMGPLGPITLRGVGTAGAVTGLADVDFGETDCGSQAPAQPVRVTNSGTASFQVLTATLARGPSSPFTLSGFTAGMTVAPGTTIELTVTPKPIPAQVALPGDFSDVLEVTTSAPNDTAHLIALDQTARGAIFVWDSSNLSLETPVGLEASDLVFVRNLGNADVAVDATGQPFGVTGEAAVGGRQAFRVAYAPTVAGFVVGSVAITNARGPLCAPLPAPLRVTGTGRSTPLRVLDQSVVLQQPCDSTTPTESTLRLANDDVTPLTVTARFSTSPAAFELLDGATSVGGLPRVLAPGTTAWWTVRSRQPLQTLVEDFLVVTTDRPGEAPRLVRVSTVPVGAAVSLSAPRSLVRGTPGDLLVTNDGNTDAVVRFSSSDPAFTVPPATTVAAGTRLSLPLAYTGTSGSEVQATVTSTVDAPACRQPPPLVVSGRALSAQLRLSRNALDFGLVSCGAGPSPSETVTLSNVGSSGASWSVGAVPPAWEVRPLNGTLGPAQSVELSVTHRGFMMAGSTAPQRHTIVVTAGADELPLDVTARSGHAELVEVGGLVDFPPTSVPGTSATRVRYGNRGTVPSLVRLSSNRPEVTAGSLAVLPGEIRSIPVSFAPTDAGVVLATLTATADRLCGATLAARSLSGQASAERVLVPSHPAFDLGSVTCQVNGPFGGAVLLRNPSTSPVTFTATLVADAGTWTLTPTTGSVPPGAVAQLEVRTPVLADVPTIAGAGNALVEVTSSQGTLRLPIDIAPRGADVTGVAAPGRTADELVVGLVNVGARRATLSLTFVADPGASVMATPTSSPVVVEAFSSTFVTVTRSAGTGAGELRLGPVSGAGEVCRANPVRLMF